MEYIWGCPINCPVRWQKFIADAWPNPAGPGRAEPSRARAEPSRAEPSASASRAEPSRGRAELSRVLATSLPYQRSRCMFFRLFSTPPTWNAYFSDHFPSFPSFLTSSLLPSLPNRRSRCMFF